MKKMLPILLLMLLGACGKGEPSVDAVLPPGTFNLSTWITDAGGRSLDLAGDWAVFQDPDETRFTHFLHFDQTSETVYSVTENEVFMLEYERGLEELPRYATGAVDKCRSVFLWTGSRDLIYINGRTHDDYRAWYSLYHAFYGDPDPYVVIDDDTLGFEDRPTVRLRRIKSFQD